MTKPKAQKIIRDYLFENDSRIFGSNLNVDRICFTYPDLDTEPGQIYDLDPFAVFDYRVEGMAIKTDTGTATVAIKINGTAIEDLEAVVITDTISYVGGNAFNDVVEDDRLTLEILAVTDATTLTGNVKITRM